MALIENSQELTLPRTLFKLPGLQITLPALRVKILLEAIQAAQLYQEVIIQEGPVRPLSTNELLAVASVHYKRQLKTDWIV